MFKVVLRQDHHGAIGIEAAVDQTLSDVACCIQRLQHGPHAANAFQLVQLLAGVPVALACVGERVDGREARLGERTFGIEQIELAELAFAIADARNDLNRCPVGLYRLQAAQRSIRLILKFHLVAASPELPAARTDLYVEAAFIAEPARFVTRLGLAELDLSERHGGYLWQVARPT